MITLETITKIIDDPAIPDKLTTSQVGKLVGLNRRTIYHLIIVKKLPAYMVGTQYEISKADLTCLADRHHGKPRKR